MIYKKSEVWYALMLVMGICKRKGIKTLAEYLNR